METRKRAAVKLVNNIEKWEKPENLKKITDWASTGMTTKCLSGNMGVSTTTLYKWINKSELIKQALEEGVTETVENVENALYLAATEDRNFNAIRFFLVNRAPDRWKDKRENENHNSNLELIQLKIV